MWPGGKQKAATVWPGLHARPLKLTLLLLLLLSRFSRVRLCATPEMAAYQALFSGCSHFSYSFVLGLCMRYLCCLYSEISWL